MGLTKSEVAERRRQIDELLHNCTDKKLLRGMGDDAMDWAEKAYRLAKDDPELSESWRRKLAAYRLAHLILRNRPQGDELHRADELLADAGGDTDILGPMPRLYRLAVLHRLTLDCPEDERERYRRRLGEAFELASKSVDSWFKKPEGDQPKGEGDRRAADSKQGPLQDGLFNMLELAAYFLGFPYKSLEGKGGPFRDLMLGPDSWEVVGTALDAQGVKMPRQLACAELEEWGRIHPESVLFCLSRKEAKWRVATDGEWKNTNEDQLRLLANLLKERQIPSEELRRRVVKWDSEDPVKNFRQVKRRLNTAIRTLTGAGLTLIPEPDRRTQEQRLTPGLTIFGSVETYSLKSERPPRRRS